MVGLIQSSHWGRFMSEPPRTEDPSHHKMIPRIHLGSQCILFIGRSALQKRRAVCLCVPMAALARRSSVGSLSVPNSPSRAKGGVGEGQLSYDEVQAECRRLPAGGLWEDRSWSGNVVRACSPRPRRRGPH